VVRKIYLHLASSIGVLALSTQPASALVEPSEPTVFSSERIVTTEAVSATASLEAPSGNLLGEGGRGKGNFEGDSDSPHLPILFNLSPFKSEEAIPPELDAVSEAGGQRPTDEESFEPFVETLVAEQAVATLKTTPATTTVSTQAATPEPQTVPTAASMDQVTSVTQLSDVQPTDWAFQALQSLVERYSCLVGYPDGTYRGNRALTRYEFAAGLNACLDQVNKLIATATADWVTREDLATSQRLQEEFSAELATLRGRVDSLEARMAELEVNQFSTTTKLVGQAIFAVNEGGFSGDRIISPTGAVIATEDPNATVIYRASLNLNTSFFGTDLLQIRLVTGSDGSDDNAAGFLEPNFGSVLDFSVPGRNDQYSLSRLYYSFTPLKDFNVTLGSALVAIDYVDRNSYTSALDFSTQALSNNFILFPRPGGAGAVIDWNPGKGPFKLRALYVATNAANSNSGNQNLGGPSASRVLFPPGGGEGGLFGDTYQGFVELEYSPNQTFALRLQYSGGKVFNNPFNAFGLNFELALSQQLGVFGRYGYGDYNGTPLGDLNPNYWMAGVGFRDLFVPGALAGIAAGQPFIENAIGSATQTNLEAFYNLPISDNIRLTPLVQVIIDPGNQNSNGTIVTGTVRSVFSF
jgi:porin